MYKILVNLLLRFFFEEFLNILKKREKNFRNSNFFHKLFYILKISDKIIMLNIIRENNIFGKQEI